jgi:phosphohistidine phosphatase
MDLILWRHADAGEPIEDDAEQDLQRQLSAKGHKQAARMGEWLNRFLPDSTRVLVSPAVRCQQTAQALGRKVQTREALGPGGTVADLLRLVRWPERREPVLVVGHQPTLGLVAAQLVGGTPQSWSVRKGAVWWLHARERSGSGRVTLNAVVSPDLL